YNALHTAHAPTPPAKAKGRFVPIVLKTHVLIPATQLWDAPDNPRAYPPGEAYWQPLPQANKALVFGVIRPHFAGPALAQVVLPHGLLRESAPLLFEAIGVAVQAAAAEVE